MSLFLFPRRCAGLGLAIEDRAPGECQRARSSRDRRGDQPAVKGNRTAHRQERLVSTTQTIIKSPQVRAFCFYIFARKVRFKSSGWWSGSFKSADNNLVADSIAKVSIQDLTPWMLSRLFTGVTAKETRSGC